MTTIRRNLEAERSWLIESARGVVVESAEALAELSELRSIKLAGQYVSDPMTILIGIDQAKEAIDEIADTVNRVRFLMQEESDWTEGEMDELMSVLRWQAKSYDVLRRYTAHA